MLRSVFDRIAAGMGLVALSPILLSIAGIVWMTMGRPILFRQMRPGLRGRLFEIVKFRTMKEPTSESEPDSGRITRVGAFLRASSLDELPTLWNVLKGEMSLVGPRPLLVDYLERYTPEQARRHQVKPGITGWAQVNGRNSTTWEERLAMDVWYVDHRTFWMDMKILGRTVFAVIKRDGISAEGHSTMPKFLGDEKVRVER